MFNTSLKKSIHNLAYLEFMRDVSAFGTSPILIFLAYLVGLPLNNILMIILFLAVINAIVSAIKLTFFTHRPIKQTFANIFEKVDAGSFPSAHAARTTFASFAIFFEFGERLWLLAFVIPVLVSISRISLKKHYLKDVLGGAFLGLLVYFFLYNKIL